MWENLCLPNIFKFYFSVHSVFFFQTPCLGLQENSSPVFEEEHLKVQSQLDLTFKGNKVENETSQTFKLFWLKTEWKMKQAANTETKWKMRPSLKVC